jgi:hypothetical protein
MLRTGPLMHRGANVSRVVPGAPATVRRTLFPRVTNLKAFGGIPLKSKPPIIESSCLHAECKLPINLRQFLAQQFDPILDSDNDSILDLAANADEVTLSRVARAIRRYSTSRAREAWAECSVTLADFEREVATPAPSATLCLACSRLEFGAAAGASHNGPNCLTVNLLSSDSAPEKVRRGGSRKSSATIADRMQRQIEDFRAMRAAFGSSHFDLDCYVTNRRLMFSWRPLEAATSASSG